MERFFWISQLMLAVGAGLRFGIALLPVAGVLEMLGWFLPGGVWRRTSRYLLHFALLALGVTAILLAIVMAGFRFRIYLVLNAWWFTVAMVGIGLVLAGLQRWAADTRPARLLFPLLLALAVYLILAIPYLRAQTRWLSWLFFLAPSLFLAYLPPLLRALADNRPDACAATPLLWFLLVPAVVVFYATTYFGLAVLNTFPEGTDFFAIGAVYRGLLPLFLLAVLFSGWTQFGAVGRAVLPERKAWAGLIGGYAGGVLAAALVWFGVTIFDTLAL